MTAGRLWRAAAAAALLLSAQIAAWAQPVPVPSLVRRDGPDAVTARASRTTPLTLDGRLDEAIYTTVAPLTDFLQQEPREGQPATEKTEAWILYDDTTLYIAARCWDSHPEREVANELRRDNGNILGNENFTFVIDTFHDKRNGYLFQTNPLGALRDSDTNVRVQAVSVIGFLKLEEAVPALKSATGDADPLVRRAAVGALTFSQTQTARETIVRALGDSDWMVREIAAETLAGAGGGKDCAAGLLAVLDDPFWQVRLKAVRSLGRLKHKPAVPAIVPALGHPQANLRKEAAGALGEIADPAAKGALEAVADDPDPDVRKNVRWALQQIAAGNAA